MAGLQKQFREALKAPVAQRGFRLGRSGCRTRSVPLDERRPTAPWRRRHRGDHQLHEYEQPVGNDRRRAAGEEGGRKGAAVKPYVKTSLAPGSRVVTDYLRRAGLEKPLEALGFYTVGYGCTTCIGNSGPLPAAVTQAITEGDLVAAAVLSGNRNFEGRVSPLVKANYLASPPLVVAYALAGTVDIDLTSQPLGQGRDGQDVYLKDVWPSRQEVADTMSRGRHAGALRPGLRRCLVEQSRMERNRHGHRRALPVERSEHLYPGAALPCRPDPRTVADPLDSATPASSWPWVIRPPPTIFHPPARSPRTAPPAATSKHTVLSPKTSTVTARDAATTA